MKVEQLKKFVSKFPTDANVEVVLGGDTEKTTFTFTLTGNIEEIKKLDKLLK